MEFLDNTGHIFTLPSYEEKPIGYEYEEKPYIFWFDVDTYSFLSVNNYYAKCINVLIDLSKFGLEIDDKVDDRLDIEVVLESQIYKLVNPTYLQDVVSSNDTLLDIVDISEHCSQKLTNDDLFLVKTTENYIDYAIMPLYVVGYVNEPGTWISNILIHISTKKQDEDDENPIVHEWCPISIGGQYQEEYEELTIHGQNMGVKLPKDILKGVYQASFINDNFNETLYSQKVKEYMLNFMGIKGEIGNFNSAINGMTWFGYGDKLTISKLLNTDNNVKQQYLHDYFNITYDLLDSFKTFRNSAYIALRLRINMETGKYEKQDIDMLYEDVYKRILEIEVDDSELIKQNDNIDAEYENDWTYIGEEDIRKVRFAGEGNPILEDLLSKNIKIKVGHKNEQYDYIKSYFNFSMNELGIKLSCMKYYYEKYFLPIHLKVHSATLTHKVYGNDLKLTSVNRVGITEQPICTEDTAYDVIFPADHIHYFKKQTHYVDDNMNEFKYKIDQPDRKFFYICDTCANIPITFTSIGKYYDCVLLLEKIIPHKLHINFIYNNDLLFNIDKQLMLFDSKNQIVSFDNMKFAVKFYNGQKFSFVFNTYKEMIDYIILNAEVHDEARLVEYSTNEISLEGITGPIELTDKTQYIHQENGHYCYIIPSKKEITYNENGKYVNDSEHNTKFIKVKKVRDYFIKILTQVEYIETMIQYRSDNIYNDEIGFKYLDEFQGFDGIVTKTGKEIRKFYQEESERVYESHFRFIQTEYVNQYLNFIIHPKSINKNIDYWIDNKFIIRLLVNNKWYNYEFELKIPEFHIQLGNLQYKYWENPDKYVTNFAQIKYIDKERVVFNSFMHEPELVTVNNINYVQDLIRCAKNEHMRYFSKQDFIQNGDFYKYVDFYGLKIYLHSTMWGKDIILPIDYLTSLNDENATKILYMFYYNQFVYLFEESGEEDEQTIEYVAKYWEVLGEDLGILHEDSYEDDEMLNFGLTVDRNFDGANDRLGYALRTNYVWIKYSNHYMGKFMSNHPSNNDENYQYIGISYDQVTSVESDNEKDYYWTDLTTIEEGMGIPEPFVGRYTHIKYADRYPDNATEIYNTPTAMTRFIGVCVNSKEQQSPDDYTKYAWNYYLDGEGFLTNKDEQIFWLQLDENLDRFIWYTPTDMDYEDMNEEDKKYASKIYIDIPKMKPILQIPVSVLNYEQLRVFIIRNYIYIVAEDYGQKNLVTKYYLKEGRVIGEGNVGIILEDNSDINEIILKYVDGKPSHYEYEGKMFTIYESLHRTRTDMLVNEYVEKVNIAPSNKYLNSVLLFDLYKKELNEDNLTDNDNILPIKSNFKVLCQGIQFSNSVSNYGKIMLKGKQEFNGLTTDNIDLFSFYWNNKENYEEVEWSTNTDTGYYVYQVFDQNYNIIPYKFSSSPNAIYKIPYDIDKKYINLINSNIKFKDKFYYNEETGTLGLQLTNEDFKKIDGIWQYKGNVDEIINNLFVQSYVTIKEENGVRYYFIGKYEIVFNIKFLTFDEDGNYIIGNTIKNADYDSIITNNDITNAYLFINFKLLERRNVKFAPINVAKLQSDRIIVSMDEGAGLCYVIVDGKESEKVQAIVINDEGYVKNVQDQKLEITDNPGLYWIDISKEKEILNKKTEDLSKFMEDQQTLIMGNNVASSAIRPQSVIQSLDEYLSIIESNHVETEHDIYNGKNEVEYYINPYTYKNYLEYDLTGQEGLFKLYYETNYPKCRMIVYIVDENGESQIINENNTKFTLTGKEQKVLALFQIDDDPNVLSPELGYYIRPYIYKLRYELNPIMYADTMKNDWSKMKIRIYDTDLEYEIGNNTSPETLKLYNDFFKEQYIVLDSYGGRFIEPEFIKKDIVSEDSIDDKDFKVGQMRFIYSQVVELGLYLDYDLYLMHDFEKWHVLFISRQTCDKVLTPNQLNIKSHDDIEIPLDDVTYVLKFVKHEKEFLINRMECNYKNGVNHFDKSDIIVASIRNNKRLPIDLDISSKWNANLMSVGKTKEYKVSSNNEMGIISIPNGDNEFESGYYNINVGYSLNGMNQQEMKQSSRFLVK